MTKIYQDGVMVAWELRACPDCKYAIDKCSITDRWEFCPLCMKGGKEVKLSDALNVYRPRPEFKWARN